MTKVHNIILHYKVNTSLLISLTSCSSVVSHFRPAHYNYNVIPASIFPQNEDVNEYQLGSYLLMYFEQGVVMTIRDGIYYILASVFQLVNFMLTVQYHLCYSNNGVQTTSMLQDSQCTVSSTPSSDLLCVSASNGNAGTISRGGSHKCWSSHIRWDGDHFYMHEELNWYTTHWYCR